MGSLRCWLSIHDPELLGDWLAVEYGSHGLSNVQIRIPAVCRRCGQVSLEPARGEYSVSYYRSEIKSREEAMQIARERAGPRVVP